MTLTREEEDEIYIKYLEAKYQTSNIFNARFLSATPEEVKFKERARVMEKYLQELEIRYGKLSDHELKVFDSKGPRIIERAQKRAEAEVQSNCKSPAIDEKTLSTEQAGNKQAMNKPSNMPFGRIHQAI